MTGCGLGTLRAGLYGLPTYAMRTRFAQTLMAFDGLQTCSLSGSPLIRPHPVNACGCSVYRLRQGRNGFEKDKKPESTPDSVEEPDEYKTLITDAFDTL